MNEGTKTGAFWAIAVVMLAIASFVAWPVQTKNERNVDVGRPMFEEFKDPLAAASLKVVTFDELQGQLDTFEVRKDRNSGLWTIPSRNGYPADAVEHMRDAANSLVGLKILDIQTENAEDHDDLGVVEPKLEDLEVGDEGVGRLVTFKDDAQKTLASLIIGKPVPNEEGKIYVRKPGQDPVYVVKFDDAPLGTRFQDWIEDDLLKLSSIDIEQLEIKDYSAAVNMNMQVSLTRNYTATVSMDGSQWKLGEMLEYDAKNPLADPTKVNVQPDATLNATKLNEMKNALDDLKIVNVLRKPEGMSANLRANKDLLSDEEAIRSLVARGFIPASGGSQDEIEILSANGELSVGLKDGVQYVLRFGNASGLSDEENEDSADGEEEKSPSPSGVNRYLLVTARVDESHFPPPDLKPVPQSLEELEAMEAAAAAPETATDAPAATDPAASAENAEMPAETADAQPAVDASKPTDTTTPAEDAPSDGAAAEKMNENPTTEAPAADESPSTEEPKTEQPSSSEPVTEETTDAAESTDEPAADVPSDAEPTSDDSARSSDINGVRLVVAQDDGDEPTLDAPAQSTESATTESATPEASTPEAAADKPAATEELSEDEKLERLEAEQEKITKENQRKIDERKDQIAAAERRVRELNARFADWYYVIAEDTYRKLRISRDELFSKDTSQSSEDSASPAMPDFGFPGGFPGQQ